ncbi:hypothetical protein DOY81_015312 [Sarcophaga bullata]|nr:hypothetical protein DOY81_015312 [Sarcophaga bullata]
MVAQFEFDAHKDELQIGGVFIRIYNDMPTFPIVNPKQFTLDLLEYLKQAYNYMLNVKNAKTIAYSEPVSPTLSSSGDGILKPTLAPNHPQLKLQHKTGTTFDEVLNAYNRSKTRKKIETEAMLEQQQIQSQYKYDFANDNPGGTTPYIMCAKGLNSCRKVKS